MSKQSVFQKWGRHSCLPAGEAGNKQATRSTTDGRQECPPHLLLGCALLFVLLLTGCGYSTTELYPTQYTTVTVPNFTNRSNDRNVEFTLREALVKELEQRTPYKAISGTGLADTQLIGTIVRVDRKLLSRDATAGLPQEIEVTVVVDFEWKDLRTGEVIRGYRGLSAAGQFVPNRTVGEFSEDGVRLAVSRLASDIVSRMRADGW